jgi:hypothetical protein
MPSTLSHLGCSRPTCAAVLDHTVSQHLCPNCQAPLLARYDLGRARQTLTREPLSALVEQGRIGASESVVLFNTGSGHKYLEAWNAALAT